MQNYKECSDIEFEEAMRVRRDIKSGAVSVRTVSNEQLYIMYTKMLADHSHLSGMDGSYAAGLRISSGKSAEAFKSELTRRKAIPSWDKGE